MLHAKRMVLVPEQFLDNFWQKEDSSWKRPTEQKAKSLLNRELKADLNDPVVSDDIKAKQHQQHLNRFLHTARQLPNVTSEDLKTPAVQDLIDFKTPAIQDLLDVEVEKKKKKKSKKKVVFTIRRSKRKPKKIDWEEWGL
jgi:hypothetical protein